MSTSWEHLLGGYATNTLTDEEKRQLCEAALHDQTLFDALADEEALKAMLGDPEARQRILASLQATERSGGVTKERGGWWGWFRQQSSLAWAGSIAAMGLALIFAWQIEKEWGPVVTQEQEAAKSSSNDKLAFREQKPSEERKISVQKEALESNATQTDAIEGQRQANLEPASRLESNKVDRLRQIPALAKKESDAREKG
ncbi:MAG: anti-sigma factor, partial [Nitrospirota bacterium]|nr:anti-sigma factor [Nitrospirota bacterium]